MDLEKRESGLVVPKQKSEPPPVPRGSLEIQDEDHRKLAAEALSKLWDAMELSRGSGGAIRNERFETHMQVYFFVGDMLLGKDGCPEKDILT